MRDCPNTALMLSKALFAENERTAKTLIVVVKLPIIFCFHTALNKKKDKTEVLSLI
jgi:hypothetical protein